MTNHVKERRFYDTSYDLELEVRAGKSGATIDGHAAVFNRTSQNLGGFVERVAPRAFNQTLKRGPDTRGLFNHDSNLILGRTTAGTLQLSTDDVGLAYRIAVPDTSYGRDLQVSLERGDITQSSFGFYVLDDEWDLTDDGFPLRTLTEISLDQGDVSPVTFPAYLDTDVSTHALRSFSSAHSVDFDQIVNDPEMLAAVIRGDDKTDTKTADAETDTSSTKTSTGVPLSVLQKQHEHNARLPVR